jgi:hypothetical protein
MRPPANYTKIINRTRYSTATATLIAGDDFWDGHNFERQGTNCFLYKTPKGNFFFVNLTQWQGERDTLEPTTLDEAVEAYESNLTEHYVKYSEAFPEVTVQDA